MFAVIVNTVAIIIGSALGLLCKKGIPDRVASAVLGMMGIFVLFVGMSGMFKGENIIVLLVSVVIGTVIGELMDIDAAISSLGEKLVHKNPSAAGTFTQSFVAASLFFCIGAMAVVGSIQAGTVGDYTMLYIKSLLDGIEALMFTVSMGIGVMASAVCVLITESILVLLAGALAPILTDTIIAEMTSVSSLMIMAVGFNLMGVTKFKVANALPSLLLAPFLSLLFTALNIG